MGGEVAILERVRSRPLLLVLWIAVGIAACDPVRSYTIPGARSVQADGARYVVALADGIEARFHASIAITHGSTAVQVINNSAGPIEFRPAPTVLVTKDGARLPATCHLPGEPTLSIAAGQTVTVTCGFQARTSGFSYEPEFQSLTLMQPGFSRNGRPLEVVAKMLGS
jgi:hypothetical protein